jgi:hypothetical protein
VNGDYLHECFRLHSTLTERAYSKVQDLAAVEGTAKRIRSSRRLRYEDLQAIVKSEHWSAESFWRWPSRSDVEGALTSREWDFWNLPKKEEQIVAALFDVFKFIEPVSVVLRFVFPREYGIFSPPVERVLQLGPSDSSVQKYVAYVRDLRAIRDARGFTNAADVDMALWTLQKGVLGGFFPERSDLVEAFRNDRHLRAIRVKNLASALFDGLSRVDLAEALAELKPDLAGSIAATEFERLVRECGHAADREELASVIDRLASAGRIDAAKAANWDHGRQLRNRALHGRTLRPEEVLRLTNLIRSHRS